MQYVFIVSCGHSGSTLLDMILGSHEKITSLGEATRFLDYIQNNRQCTCGQRVLDCRFWTEVTHRLKLEQSSFDISVRMIDLSGIFQKFKTLSEFFVSLWCPPRLMRIIFLLLNDNRMTNSQKLYDVVNQINGTKIRTDSSKSPFRAKLMYLHSPKDVRIIHLVRDGKDVVVSHMRNHNYSTRQAVKLWRRHWYYTQMWSFNVPKSQKLTVQYERLTASPFYEVERICDFLGINFEEHMLDFRKIEHHNIGGNIMRYRKEGIYHRTRTWEDYLTKDDLRIFESLAGNIKLPEK